MKKKIKEEINQQLAVLSTLAVMRSQIVADKLGINSTDLESLEVLSREGKATAGSLAKHTGLTTGAVTGVIDRLVRSGFVARELDPKDRRKVFVVLNMKKLSEEVFPLYDSISSSMNNLLGEYSEQKLDIIMDFLKKAISVGQKDLEKLRKE